MLNQTAKKFAYTFLVVTCFFSLTSPAFAQKASADLQMISFEEFKKLNADERKSYIKDLQKLAVEMENQQKNFEGPPEVYLWQQILGAAAQAAAGDACIFAGYMSTRNAQDICTRPATKTWPVEGAQKSLCSGARQTLCNPMMYGFGPDGNGICTTSRSRPTVDCDKKFRAIPNYGGADIAKQLVSGGLAKDFDAQATQLSSYCSSAAAESQKSLCTYFKERNAFLKAKLKKAGGTPATPAAPAKKANKAADVTKKPDPAPVETPPAAAPPAAAPKPRKAKAAPKATASASTSGGSDSPVAPAVKEDPIPDPPETVPPNKPAEKPAPAPEVKKSSTPANCIANGSDIEEKRAKLPAMLQNLKDKPIFMNLTGAKSWVATASMSMRLTDEGRIKIGTYVKAPGSLICQEKYAKLICLDGINNVSFTVEGDVDSRGIPVKHLITVTPTGLTFHSDAGDGDFAYVSETEFRKNESTVKAAAKNGGPAGSQ